MKDDEPGEPNGTVEAAEKSINGAEDVPYPSLTQDTTAASVHSTQDESNGSSDPNERFEALVKDRDILRAEVTELRQSLEELQQKHELEVQAVRGKLEETQDEKEQAETQYRNLLGKVNTIKSQLGERLKADAVL